MKTHARFGGDARDFLDRLDRAEFVIRVHHGDENGFGTQRAADFFGIDHALRFGIAPHGHDSDVDSLPLKFLAAVQDRVMLDGRGDDVLARLR